MKQQIFIIFIFILFHLFTFQNSIAQTPTIASLSIEHDATGTQLFDDLSAAVHADISNGAGYNYGLFANATGDGIVNGIYFQTPNNNNNTWAVYGVGDYYYTGSFQNPSDRRLKKDIRPIESALDKVLQLRPKTYQFKTTAYPYMNLAQGQQYGFISQEVENIFPHLVEEDEHVFISSDKKWEELTEEDLQRHSIKSMSYIGFIPILTAAIQEQHKMIATKDKKVKHLEQNVLDLENQVEDLATRLAQLERLLATDETLLNRQNTPFYEKYNPSEQPLLEQNRPNPSNGKTTISYFLPKGVQDAEIWVMNNSGGIVEKIDIEGVGKGEVVLNMENWGVGSYFYGLVLEGEMVERKQLILVK